MPYATYEDLKIGKLKDTFILVQLADKTIKYLIGIVEDMLVKVHVFLLPVDFVIMDIEEKLIDRRALSLILGRPFLAMIGAIVDVKVGTFSMNVIGETVEFEIMHVKKAPDDTKRNDIFFKLNDPP